MNLFNYITNTENNENNENILINNSNEIHTIYNYWIY